MLVVLTATLPLAACKSHAYADVTSPRRRRETSTMRDRQTAGFPCVEFFAVKDQTDERTDGQTPELHTRYLLNAASANNN